jgi:hypothetical protein
MMAYTRGGLVPASNKKFYRIIIRAALLDNPCQNILQYIMKQSHLSTR